jgi:hypothetical protein
MILLGCLLAFSAAVAPRVVLILAWIFSDRWPRVWEDNWILPLLGIVFLPYTTIMYLLTVTVTPAGLLPLAGTDWLWILLGLFLDLVKWGQILANRKEATSQVQRYYPAGAPRYGGSGGTQAAVGSGQAEPSISPTADDGDSAPSAASTSPEVPEDDRPGG